MNEYEGVGAWSDPYTATIFWLLCIPHPHSASSPVSSTK
jgi:hypothetical protein